MSDVVKIRPAPKSHRHFTGRTPASAHRPVTHRKYNWKSFLQPHSFGFSQRPAPADTEMYSRRKCRQPAAGYGRGDPQTVPGPAPTEISLQEERRSSKHKSMTDTLNKTTDGGGGQNSVPSSAGSSAGRAGSADMEEGEEKHLEPNLLQEGSLCADSTSCVHPPGCTTHTAGIQSE